MKILTVCYEDMGGYIGGVRHIIEVSHNLQKLGHDLEVVAPGIRRYECELNFKIHYIPVIHKKILQPLSFLLFSFFYLLRVYRRFKPDIILTYEIFFSFIPTLLAKLFNLVHIIFVNGDTEDFKLQGKPFYVLWIIDLVRKINFRFCDIVFTVTRNLKDSLIKKYNLPQDKIVIVNNGVDTNSFRPLDKGDSCKELGLDANYFYVGFLGGLWPWHGLDLLIKSAPLVLKVLPDVKFVIVGHGPEKAMLINLIRELRLENNFIVKGEVEFNKAPLFINSFDICILFFKPVRENQGSPIKLFEYLACAKPVIATDIENYGRFLKENSVGFSVDSENPQEISEVIIKLVQDKELCCQTGKRARALVESYFKWQDTAKTIEQYLKKIVQDGQ